MKVVCQDGVQGCTDAAPYDRILVSVGARDIAPAWRDQLVEGGRLLLPLAILGPSTQLTIAFRRQENRLESLLISNIQFMMMQGAAVSPSEGPEGMDFHITAYPVDPSDTPMIPQAIIHKPHTRLEIHSPRR